MLFKDRIKYMDKKYSKLMIQLQTYYGYNREYNMVEKSWSSGGPKFGQRFVHHWEYRRDYDEKRIAWMFGEMINGTFKTKEFVIYEFLKKKTRKQVHSNAKNSVFKNNKKYFTTNY